MTKRHTWYSIEPPLFTCANTRNHTSIRPDDTPRQQRTIPLTWIRVSNILDIPRALRVASNKASWKIGNMIAKKTTSKSADSNRTKMTDTNQANHAGQWASMSACACKGRRKTKDRTKEMMPKIRVSRKGHSTLIHSYVGWRWWINIFCSRRDDVCCILPEDEQWNKRWQLLDMCKVVPWDGDDDEDDDDALEKEKERVSENVAEYPNWCMVHKDSFAVVMVVHKRALLFAILSSLLLLSFPHKESGLTHPVTQT